VTRRDVFNRRGPLPEATTDATAIVASALEAVEPVGLVHRRLAIENGRLLFDGRPFDPAIVPAVAGRVVVVGGGKAAAGLARGVSTLLAAASVSVQGLVSVPEGPWAEAGAVEVRPTRRAGWNLPTAEAVEATGEMLALVDGLGPDDLVVALVTGGGSACLEAPSPGVTLADTIEATRFLSAAGCDIRDLNTLRQAASRVKGGGLARACGAGRLLALVLSDVIGDPLDLIASGPCMPVPSRAAAALEVLERYGGLAAGIAPTLAHVLSRDAGTAAPKAEIDLPATWTTPRGCQVEHRVVGCNGTALDAAAAAARERGYAVTVRPGRVAAESAEMVGIRLAAEAATMLAAASRDGRPRALIEGGEATVVVPTDHGLGGRNQQTALAAAVAWPAGEPWPRGLIVASVGTDGEDGPTDAAGGLVDAEVHAGLAGQAPRLALRRCDAHGCLGRAGGLVRTGPTGTNVADLRLVLVRP
jgi:glycerate 2-kinase